MEQFNNCHYYQTRRNLVLDILESHNNPVTLKELKKEYRERHATDIPFSDVNDGAVHEWLSEIDSVGTTTRNNQLFYFIRKPFDEVTSSKDSKRKTSSPLVSQTVKRSRSAPENEDSTPDSTQPRLARTVRFKDQPSKQTKSRSRSEHRPQKILGAPNLYGSFLIGDDFLLGVAIYKLGFGASKLQGRLQSGFCMSGMTIKDAMYKVKEIDDDRHKTAIIYVGSVDIAAGRELIEMMQDLTQLMKVCAEKNIKPILCTLAALPNYLIGNRKDTLKGYNTYITSNPFGIPSIDINRCFKHDKFEDFLPRYYIGVPRYVSGFNKMLVLWSKEGRDRVYEMLMKNLGMALVATGNVSHHYI